MAIFSYIYNEVSTLLQMLPKYTLIVLKIFLKTKNLQNTLQTPQDTLSVRAMALVRFLEHL